jgi:ankyrin repeat protein
MKLNKLFALLLVIAATSHANPTTDQLITLVDKARRNDPYLQADIKELIKQGANPNATNANSRPALSSAAFNNYPATITVLIEGGADVDATDNNGDTALIIASRQGNLESVKALINKNANPIIPNNKGETALSVAGQISPVKKKEIVESLNSVKTKMQKL